MIWAVTVLSLWRCVSQQCVARCAVLTCAALELCSDPHQKRRSHSPLILRSCLLWLSCMSVQFRLTLLVSRLSWRLASDLETLSWYHRQPHPASPVCRYMRAPPSWYWTAVSRVMTDPARCHLGLCWLHAPMRHCQNALESDCSQMTLSHTCHKCKMFVNGKTQITGISHIFKKKQLHLAWNVQGPHFYGAQLVLSTAGIVSSNPTEGMSVNLI